jgi:hypothetical protein
MQYKQLMFNSHICSVFSMAYPMAAAMLATLRMGEVMIIGNHLMFVSLLMTWLNKESHFVVKI